MRLLVLPVLLLATLAAGDLLQITSDTGQDINPSAGNDITFGNWIVWQSDRNGNWDIYGSGKPPWWHPESLPRPVCTDSADDLHPVLATDPYDLPKTWCVWERREGSFVSTIWAAHDTGDLNNPFWATATQIGQVLNTTGDSAFPSAVCPEFRYVAEPWVVWPGHDTSGSAVYFTYYDGDSWRTPQVAVQSQNLIRHPRIGRGQTETWDGYPLLVWEEDGDILISRYQDSAWSAPESVAPSPAYDWDPEVASFHLYGYPHGPFIVWQSLRDGDTAVYVTGEDSFSVGYRLCDTGSVGANYSCIGGMTTSLYVVDVPMTAWVSNRDGNLDIYSTENNQACWDYAVDNDSHADLNPTVSSYATLGGGNWAWFFWQSDRTGNWDIWCVAIEGPGLEEGRRPQASGRKLAAAVARSLPQGAAVFDAMGRRVVNPRSGIYFVREGRGGRGQGGAGVRKVVLQH